MLTIFTKAIVCCFELYMLYDLGKNLLSLRMKSEKGVLCADLLILAAYLSLNYLNQSYLNLLIVPILYILFSITNFSGTVFKKTCIAITYYMMSMVPEFIFALLLNMDAQTSFDTAVQSQWKQMVMLIFMKTITFVLVKCICQVHKKDLYDRSRDRNFIALLVLPFATMILLVGVYYIDTEISGFERVVLICGCGLLLFSNIFVFYLFEKMLLNENKAQKLERLYVKSQVEQKYIQQIEDINRSHRALLHDMNRFIRTAAELTAAGSTKEALSLYQDIGQKIQISKPAVYTKHKVLNTILSERKKKAMMNHVSFDIEIDPETDFSFMDDIDLISIVGNLLDNAYEAAEKDENRGYIRFYAYTKNQNHFLILKILNSFKEKPIPTKNGYKTSKHDRQNHGIGIHTVEQIVKNHGGKMQIVVENKEFRVTLFFPIF